MKELSPMKTWLVVMISYIVLLLWGGGYVAVPILRGIVGGTEFDFLLHMILWGLILTMAYVSAFRLFHD